MNLLRRTVTYRLANNFPSVLEAFVSLKRTQEFLLLQNLPHRYHDTENLGTRVYRESTKDGTYHSIVREPYSFLTANQDSENEIQAVPIGTTIEQQSRKHYEGLKVSCLTCNMKGSCTNTILCEVSFDVPTRSLTVVTGPVGSGKSTLLSSIAGEVTISSGTIVYSGNIAYVPQKAWLFSGSIRDNILFGKSYDEDKFANIVEVCNLQKDIARLPQGDLTFVGERGTVLSGGQRARVSLARAVYADADLYLLDDPLSSVDAKVGEHIFNKCICDQLCDKIRILVSHDRKHFMAADQVLVLEKGSLTRKGDFLKTDKEHAQGKIVNSAMKEKNKRITQRNEDQDPKSGNPLYQAHEVNPPEHLQISQEDRAVGTISFKLYWNYFRAGMHPPAIFAVIALFIVSQGLYLIIT